MDRRPQSGQGSAPRRLRHPVRVAVLTALAVVVAAVLALRWFDPPTTAFRLADGQWRPAPRVQAEHIAPDVVLALLAQEDQRFFTRADPVGWRALRERARRPGSAGGSTLQVQLVKNLFLYRHADPFRKGVLEPPLAHLLDVLVPRRRQVELYLNVAQFGPGLYGICAASWSYYDRPPDQLTPAQAASLVSLLPHPGLARPAAGGGVLVAGAPQSRPLTLELRMRVLARQRAWPGWPVTSPRASSCAERPGDQARAAAPRRDPRRP